MTIMAMTAENLARLGANLEITADAKYMAATVENIIRIAVGAGGHVTVHASNYMAATLENFVKIGRNSVTIVV